MVAAGFSNELKIINVGMKPGFLNSVKKSKVHSRSVTLRKIALTNYLLNFKISNTMYIDPRYSAVLLICI